MAVVVTPAPVPALADDIISMEHDVLVEDVGDEELNEVLRKGKARMLDSCRRRGRRVWQLAYLINPVV
jgi:hypothetical protein